ncbi:MarC family protein [Candidatus Paracaedibacter symbiosus]|uniref:MarC family protein n=1 Tax=Candidatus Paracaedibacter symbiosus TaxID=244582 RepID=UPI000509C140|nr:MarC family protein [Candidatus Paracaedibacter symbiosus]
MEGFLWQAFVTLFVIIDPFAVLPMFIALTRNESIAHKRRTALKASVIATILLLIFAFSGDKLLDAMGISEPAFRIAGGFLLLLAAIEMVVAKSSGIRSTTGDEAAEAAHRDDISVFPLAIPLIAGPGALTSIVVLMRQAEEINFLAQLGVIIILIVVLLITYLSLLIGDRILKILGVTGTNVLTRVFGIILAALAVQNMLNGITIVVNSFINR